MPDLSGGATITTLTGSADPNAPAAATVTVQGLRGREAWRILSPFQDWVPASSPIPPALARAGDVAVHAKTSA